MTEETTKQSPRMTVSGIDTLISANDAPHLRFVGFCNLQYNSFDSARVRVDTENERTFITNKGYLPVKSISDTLERMRAYLCHAQMQTCYSRDEGETTIITGDLYKEPEHNAP